MNITSDTIYTHLLFSSPVKYADNLTLYPLRMKDIVSFNLFKQAITVRKNSTFPVKKIIKMNYLEFLFFCHGNQELADEYEMPALPFYYTFAFQLLKMVFVDQDVKANVEEGGFKINDVDITSDMFDDFRRIILLQNGVDFDIDEFIHYDTERELEKAQAHINRNDHSTLEDYVDSICIAMGITEDVVQNFTIRKFWRFIKRISKRDIFQIMKTAESSGFVKLKEPVSYWMNQVDGEDKYKDVKTNSSNIRKMVSGE